MNAESDDLLDIFEGIGVREERAGLGVGHIWTMVQCPAYRTLNGADCTCGGAR